MARRLGIATTVILAFWIAGLGSVTATVPAPCGHVHLNGIGTRGRIKFLIRSRSFTAPPSLGRIGVSATTRRVGRRSPVWPTG